MVLSKLRKQTTKSIKSVEIDPTLLELKAEEMTRTGLSYQDKPFKLRGGGESHWYFDTKKAVASGVTLGAIGRLALAKVRFLGIDCRNICAMGSGGYAIMHSMVLADPEWYSMTWAYLGQPDDPDNGLHGSNVERKQVLLIDDVLSTGSSLVTTINMIRDAGGEVRDTFVAVTRSNGLAEARLQYEQEVNCNALFTFSEQEHKILAL